MKGMNSGKFWQTADTGHSVCTFDAPLSVVFVPSAHPALATAALLRPAGHPFALTVAVLLLAVLSSSSLLLLLPPASTSKCDSAAAAFDLTVGALSPHLYVHDVCVCVYTVHMKVRQLHAIVPSIVCSPAVFVLTQQCVSQPS
jgi:Na+/pantothenate symporter